MKRILTLLCLSLAMIFLLAGCSKDQSTSTSDTKTVTYEDQSYTVPQNPTHIVAFSNSIAKMVMAVDGKLVARVTSSEALPKDLEALPSVGHTATINMEQLLGLKPDLVIGLTSQHQKFADQLKSNNIPYMLINYDGINDNIPLIEALGKITNHEDKAKEITDTYNKQMSTVMGQAKEAGAKQKVTVAVLRATGKAVTAETDKAITASMIKELGITNVATSHPIQDQSAKTVPYSLETLATDNPDIIFVVTMGKKEEIDATFNKEMKSNPAWNGLKAVQNNKVIFLPSNLFLLNPGLDTPKAMAELLHDVYGITVNF